MNIRITGLDFSRRRSHKGSMQDTRVAELSETALAPSGLAPVGLGIPHAPNGEGLLAATGRACRLLLEAPEVMSAVPGVLRLLGEAAGADRVNMWRTQTDVEGARWLVVVSEWVAEGVTPYLGDPSKERCAEAAKESTCCLLRAGQSLCLFPEGQDRPGSNFDGEGTRTKAIIPIMVDGEFSGVVGFDNTRQSRAIEPAELSALETAAGVIGAALHRERLISTVRQERERAAEQRMWELARANAVIRGNLERLAREPDMKAFLGHLLLEATRQFDAPSGTVVVRKPDKWLVAAHVRNGQLAPPPFAPSVPADGSALSEELGNADGPCYCNMSQYSEDDGWPGMSDYHRSEGHAGMVVFPLLFGEHSVGFIMLCFRRADAAALCNSELLVALAQQATLAVEMMRLAYSSKEAAVLGERNRIGREIHDGLAQAFTGILMQLSAAEELGKGPHEDIAQRIRNLAREGLAEARRSVMALRPDPARGGLPHALSQLAERSSVPGRVNCSFEGEDAATGLAPEHEHALLRIAQEAVSNAVRHGQPQTVRIAWVAESAHWLLCVEDDGAGMDDSPGRCAQQGFGLTNMRERANAIGGEWFIDSRTGLGTRVSVRLPRKA